MNANHFAELLQDSSRLYQISYQALKTLVLQYPYSPNLRFLLLVKSKMENHKEYDRNLKSAALYAPSRSYLFHLLERIETSLPLKPTQNSVGQPVMELKDLRELRGDLEALEIDTTSEDVMLQAMEANLPVAIPSTTIQASPSKSDLDDEDEDWESITGLEGADNVHEELNPPDLIVPLERGDEIAPITTEVDAYPEDLVDMENNLHIPEEEIALSLKESASPIEETIETIGNDTSDDSAAPIDLPPLDIDALWEMEDEETTHTIAQTSIPVQTAVQAPMPRTAFMPQWHLEAIEDEVEEEEETIDATEATAKKSSKKDKKMSESAQLAAASLEEQEDVASETLAQLLVSQGYSAKAIRIYERLSLQNPEKSEIFASAIARIQEK